MRVLCLSPYLPLPWGGIEKEMLAVAGELRDLGHEVTLLATTARFPRGRNPAPQGVPDGVAVVRLPGFLRSTLRGFAPARPPLVVPGLARAALASAPDLAIVFNLGWGPALRPALAALRGRARLLYRTHYHPPGGRLRRLKTRYLMSAVALADRALADTAQERDQLLATGRIRPGAIAVIPPGVHLYPPDPERVERLRREHGLAGKVVIAHTARLSRFKGTLDLVAVLPAVRRESGRDVVLLLIGPAEGEAAAELEAAIAQAGVAAHVRRTGVVADDRTLRALLATADLFALPSAYEAYGIVYLEALAEGLPCVGCDVGGVREAVGEEGLLIPTFGDHAALRQALVRLATDDDLRRSLGQRGRRRVLAERTWRQTTARILAVAADIHEAGGAGT